MASKTRVGTPRARTAAAAAAIEARRAGRARGLLRRPRARTSSWPIARCATRRPRPRLTPPPPPTTTASVLPRSALGARRPPAAHDASSRSPRPAPIMLTPPPPPHDRPMRWAVSRVSRRPARFRAGIRRRAGSVEAAAGWRADRLGTSPRTATARPRREVGDGRQQQAGWRGRSNSARLAAILTMRPRYITPTSSAMWRTTARSWLMNRKVSPSSSCRSRIRLRICACTDTSSAEVGLSQTRTAGWRCAHAMQMRRRCPPENSCGYFRAVGRRQADLAQQSGHARTGSGPSRSSPEHADRLGG